MKRETPAFYLQGYLCIYSKPGKKKKTVLVVLRILTKHGKVSLLHQLWLNILTAKEGKKVKL